VAKAQTPAPAIYHRRRDQASDDDCSNEKTEPPLNLPASPVAPPLADEPLVKVVPDQQPLEGRTDKQNGRAHIGALIK
jgi:hypothetical protein